MILDSPHYQDVQILYSGSRTLVYRGIRKSDRQAVIIKILGNPNPSFNELVQFRNQYTITCDLQHPHILQPLALERYGNGYALIMPDTGAIALPDFWRSFPPSIEKFLNVAIQLADALHYLSQKRIIHKDIKTANIIIHPKTHHVQLIDFSISSLLPKEKQQLLSPNVLEGSLSYLSPEQTGRMNRGIDYRSDFYSLGITFYELLAGTLPFTSNDPMELVHCHLAQNPQFPPQSQVPKVLQALVLKLMAKNAEDRYQSALGLKSDLEQCLHQLETTGKIVSFDLGQEDRSDRFIIPEKLYGREPQVQTLLNAFMRVAAGRTEMMLVAGFSGIGKTAVIHEVHKPIVKKRGYFIQGKYDQFNRNIPFSAFVQAFRELMVQLLGESDKALEQWKAKILQVLGENAQVVIEVVPELEAIIGQQLPAPKLEGVAAQNRFNLLFQNFISIFATSEHPLVIFLDDLQWADSASLQLMKVLMGDTHRGYLLILGAYRDNEVFPTHPFIVTLAELEQDQGIISTITLDPLEPVDIDRLIADTLLCPTERVQPLSELVYQQTQGNPFFTTQLLKGLYEDQLLKFNWSLGEWEWNLVDIYNASLASDVVQFMASRLQKFQERTQYLLTLAACIGNSFDLETLSIVCEKSLEEVARDLWEPLQEGLVLPMSESYKIFQNSDGQEPTESQTVAVSYRFLHDRVQQAAYSLIPESDKKATHLKIGQLLLENTSEEDYQENIFTLVNQLNYGADLIADQSQQYELAHLNSIAGAKAKHSTAYEAAIAYFQTGIRLLGKNSWQTHEELTVNLQIKSMEAEYLQTHFDRAKETGEVILQQASRILDRVKVYELYIQIYSSENNNLKGIELGLKALKLLNIPLKNVSIEESDRLQLPSLEEVPTLPELRDENQQAALRILTHLLAPVLLSKPELLLQIVLTQVHLCIEQGHCALAALSYSWYGMLLCGSLGDIEKGYHAGQLSLKLLERFHDPSLKCHVWDIVYVFIKPWKDHIQDSLDPLLEGFQTGREFGDIIYASYCALNYCCYLCSTSLNLKTVTEKQTPYLETLIELKNNLAICHTQAWHQFGANLQGLNADPTQLVGETFDERKTVPELHDCSDFWTLFNVYLLKAILSYLFGDREAALAHAVQAQEYTSSVVGFMYSATHKMYYSLILLAQDCSSAQLEQVSFNQTILHRWAIHASMNFQHKYDLVEAERYRVLGQRTEAIEYYDRAIAGAKANEYLQEESLANELAAKFYLEWGKEKVAAGYMQEAYYGYAQWGAKAKTDQLATQYPQLLAPIFNRSSTPVSGETLTSTSAETSSALDLLSVIKASQVLSEEISLNALLSKFMHILIENAGATHGTLLLGDSGTWEMMTQYRDRTCHLTTTPLEEARTLPTSIINTVKHSQETVLINNLQENHPFITDSYLLQHAPKSLVCMPILTQGQFMGILYLENDLTSEAFTPERLNVLNLLTTQAAISINNARFYQTLEDKVTQRTGELAAANAEITKLNQKLKVENLRLGAELDIARRVQQMILPRSEELEAIANLDIAGYMAPADEVGGDYYDVLVEDGVVTIGIGDVTGHGLESGLVMMMAQTIIRTLKEVREADPVRFLNTVNFSA